MDDDGEVDGVLGHAFFDELELFGEDGSLHVAGRLLVVVVEAEFAPGDAFGVLGDAAEVVPDVRASVGIEGMDPGGAPDVGVALGDGEGVEAVVGGG